MKKRLTVLLSSLFVIAALCIGVLAVPVTANADDAPTVVSVESAENEMLYFGDVINSTAKVHLSDGSSETRSVIWDNLNANEVNVNFGMAEAVGTVEGTTERVSRRFFTLPRGLVYFVNCGSITGHEDEGYNDIYYGLNTAIIENYDAPTTSRKLLNEKADQELSGGASWGYAPYNASYPISNKRMPTKAGDPLPPAYPYNAIRSTDTKDNSYGIKYTLGNLTAGTSYRIYLGTRSHWHMRRSTPWINGVEKSQLEISAVAKITVYDNVEPTTNDSIANSIQIWLKGASLDEGNCAFIAIQTMEEANKMATEAPGDLTIGGNLEMGQTSFVVGGATAGSKVQISLSEAPYNILYEGIAAADGDYTVNIPLARLNNVFALYLTSVNTYGASKPTTVYITDITDFSFTPASTAFTSDDLAVAVAGKSDSGIMRLVITHNYLSTTYDESYDSNFGKTDYTGTFMVTENGVYTFTLYSGNNAFVSQDITITQIDKEDVSLSVGMALSGFTGNKPRLALNYEGAAPIASYAVYDVNGTEKSSGTGSPADMELDYGRYVFSVTSESGKIATTSAVITENPTYYTVTGEQASRGVKYTFKAANGKTIQEITAVSVNSNGIASYLMGTTTSVNNYTNDTVYVRVLFTDGTVEFTKLNTTVVAAAKKKCGSAVSATSLPIALGALVLCGVVIFVRKKKAKAN